MERDEQLFMVDHFLLPCRAIDVLQLIESSLREVEAIPLDVLVVGCPADRGLPGHGPPVDAVHDPAQNTKVLAEAGPQELSLVVLAEPVHIEHPRCYGQRSLHSDPGTEIVAHMVAKEWQHRHGVAADLANRPGSGGDPMAMLPFFGYHM